MNSFAILKGEKYIYVNRIKNIITNETAVLCKDECGNFCFCSIDEWINNIPVGVERSRSGNGAHMWFFFEEAVPASTEIKFGGHI